MSNAINYWSGEKGGTGKSWGSRLDCQRHLDRQQDFFLIDTDKSNATTSNYYGSYKFDKQAFFSEAAERASTANPLLDAALLRPVVANCRAGTFLKFAHLAGNEKGATNGGSVGHSDALSVCE